VISVKIGDEIRAYLLLVPIWHEIVNDKVGSDDADRRVIVVTHCPLCDVAIVFDRDVRHGGKDYRDLRFGTTGKLRRSDLVMWDRLVSAVLGTSHCRPIKRRGAENLA